MRTQEASKETQDGNGGGATVKGEVRRALTPVLPHGRAHGSASGVSGDGRGDGGDPERSKRP